MNKAAIIRLTIFSSLLLLVVFFYSNLGFLSFSNISINDQLPKLNKINNQSITTPQQVGSVDTAEKLTMGFEIVGIRGNNPDSTIIILENGDYKLIEQGDNISSQISFSHVEGSRAYFFDGKDYSFLDIIGSKKSFNQDRIDLIKD